MSLNTTLRNVQADSLASALGAGTLTLYAGTIPASSNAALGGAVVKATHTLTGFLASVNGSAVANAIDDVIIGGTGTEDVTFARLQQGSNILQLPVGTSGAPVTVSSLSYTESGNSIVNSVTITQPAT